MVDIEKQSLMRRVYLLTFIEVFVPGIVLSLAVLVVSLFRTDRVAEYTRFFALLVLLACIAGGVFRVLLVYMSNRLRERRENRRAKE